LEEILNFNISLTVYNPETLKNIVLLKPKKPVNIHLKVETGLNRQGVKGEELIKLAKFALENPRFLKIEGVSTHYANIEDTLNPSFGQAQLHEFNCQVRLIKKLGARPVLLHTAASAAAMIYPKTRLNLVRFGIGLYGLWPSRETKLSCKGRRIKLLPVLEWKSVVAQVKDVKVGESVSYGRTWLANRRSKIAVVPVGYYDGFDRKLSNCGRVLVRGRFAPVIGRVAMNMIMIDVTDIAEVLPEDTVTLIGKQEKNEITADEIAGKIGTINYEVVARLNPVLPRLVR
jgi:alanine racemase